MEKITFLCILPFSQPLKTHRFIYFQNLTFDEEIRQIRNESRLFEKVMTELKNALPNCLLRGYATSMAKFLESEIFSNSNSCVKSELVLNNEIELKNDVQQVFDGIMGSDVYKNTMH